MKGDRKMGLWHVQTYLVSKDKIDEHEQIIKKLRKKATFQYFTKRFTPPTARVTIGKYKDMADYEKMRKTMTSDEEFMALRRQWIACVELSSYQQDYLVESPEE
jgi:hypothetical protein